MSKENHTPGPWFAVKSDQELYITPEDRDAPIICQMVARKSIEVNDGSGYFEDDFQTEDEANAILIASAPDLLEALKKIFEQIDLSSDNIMTRILNIEEIANEAIEKATNQNIKQP